MSSTGSVVLAVVMLSGVFGGVAQAQSQARSAEGVVISPARIPARDRAALMAQLEQARAEEAEAFAMLAELRKQLPELDAQKRGRLAPLTPALKATGRVSIFPLLEELAVAAPPRGELTQTAWLAWRVGLLEAVGSLRDPRAAPVLFAVLDGPLSEFEVQKAAAEAVAKLGTDRAAAKLIGLSRAAGPKRLAVIAGMGHCRRTVIAQALSELLRTRPDAVVAKHAIRSLGTAGNGWAWQTPVIQGSGEEEAVRSTAARALVDAFVAYEGQLRQGALEAVLVVDHAQTPEFIAQAKERVTTDGQRGELDRLAERFATSPFRRAR